MIAAGQVLVTSKAVPRALTFPDSASECLSHNFNIVAYCQHGMNIIIIIIIINIIIIIIATEYFGARHVKKRERERSISTYTKKKKKKNGEIIERPFSIEPKARTTNKQKEAMCQTPKPYTQYTQMPH